MFYHSQISLTHNYINEFNYKDLSNYFSAKVSYGNQKNVDALKFFKSSKSLINIHNPYLKQYIFSLILEGNVNTAIKELKSSENKKNSDFFEAYLLLIIDSINKNDFKKTTKYLNNLSKFGGNDTLNLAIYESLKNYNFLFENKRMPSNDSAFNNLSLISMAFQSCYLGEKQTQSYFDNLIHNNEDLDKYSQKLTKLEREITLFHSKIVNEISLKYNGQIDFVGFHGQTIFHNPKKNFLNNWVKENCYHNWLKKKLYIILDKKI